jgi:hypothetical protein
MQDNQGEAECFTLGVVEITPTPVSGDGVRTLPFATESGE